MNKVRTRILLALACFAVFLGVWRVCSRSMPPRRAEPVTTVELPPGRPPSQEASVSLTESEVHAPERSPARAELAAPPPERAPGAGLVWYGRVVSAETGEPLGGATLTFGMEGGAVPGLPQLESDADGRFPPIPIRALRVEVVGVVQRPGYARVLVPLAAGHGTLESECVLRLARSASLAVHVHDAQGRGREGLILRASASMLSLVPSSEADALTDYFDSNFDPWNEAWRATTDATGRCQLEELPPHCWLAVELLEGERVMKRHHDGLVLEPAEHRTLDWTAWLLGSGCQIHGSVVEADGRPVPECEVWLAPLGRTGGRLYGGSQLDATARTDVLGRFLFEDVPASWWWVTIARVPGGIVSAQELVVIAPNEKRKEVTLQVVRDLHIRGSVLRQNGVPVKACTISARCAEARFECEATTDPDGRFELGPLLPGKYTLETQVFGVQPADVAPAWPLEVEAGANDVELRLPSGGRLIGQVIRKGTGRPTRSTVWVYPSPFDPAESGEQFMTGGDGRFEFDGLETGTYQLVAWTKDGQVGFGSLVTLRPGKNPPERIVVEPGATIVVEIPGEHGVYAELSTGLVFAREWIHPGERTQLVAPPGPVRCRVYDDRVHESILVQDLSLTVAAGETKSIELLPLSPLDR